MVSSADGELRRIALALHQDFFEETVSSGDDALRDLNLGMYEWVLRTLPEECEAVVVSNVPEKARAFVDSTRSPQRNAVVDAASLVHSAFIQDPFVPVTVDGQSHLVEPRAFWGDDAYLADRIGAHKGIPVHLSDDGFEGGNVLAGDKYWFLGADSVGGATLDDVPSIEAKYSEIGSGRRLVLVYSDVAVPKAQTRDRPPGTVPKQEEIHSRNTSTTVQPIYHIDCFMTVAFDKAGNEVVLLGSPSKARDLMGGDPWPVDAALDKQLESVREVLLAQVPDLTIIHFPMPLFAEDDESYRRWRYATYANALLQRRGDQRTVWLPTFQGAGGDNEWGAVAPVEKEMRRIYEEDLGYEVILLPDCRAFAYYFAGPHCAFNYLARS